MSDLKEFYTEDKKFVSQKKMYFSVCNVAKNLNLNELLRIVTDVAVEDFTSRGMGRDVLVQHGIAILVSRYSFRFHKYPAENQRIVVRTWEEKSEALQFIRAFEVEDEKGEKLISGNSSWFLVDLNIRRLMPIKKFDAMGLREPTDLVTEHDCLPLGKISAPEDMKLLEERVIRHSDIDANGHTNNARYIAFAIDALPENLQNVEFKDFKINFAKEAMIGQKVEIWGKINEAEKKITVIGKVEGNVSFETELYY